MLRTLGKTTWDKIAVGEVFAWWSKTFLSWWVDIKKGEQNGHTITLACVEGFEDEWKDWKMTFTEHEELYKLPKSVQRLWKCE